MRTLLAALLLATFPVAAQMNSTAGSNSTSGASVQTLANPSQSITFNTEKPDSTTTLRNVPTMFAPSFGPSTPCSSVLSGGASWAGFGVMLGGSHVDKDCNRREMARLLSLIGQPDAAVALICLDEEVHKTSPQLCSRAGYVASRPEDDISNSRPVLPPAPINPRPVALPVQSHVPEGSIGYSPDNRRYKYAGGVWKLDVEAAAVVLPPQSK